VVKNPTPGKITATKRWKRPRRTQGYKAGKEEKEEGVYLNNKKISHVARSIELQMVFTNK
jgi:hypothetical protein